MLIFLLIRLSLEQRCQQWGILKAAGWSPARMRRLILLENLPVVSAGVLLGIPVGLAFCMVILRLLGGSWVGLSAFLLGFLLELEVVSYRVLGGVLKLDCNHLGFVVWD